MTEILIYTTTYCPYCHAAKSLFKSKGLPFKEINVEGDDAKRAWLVQTTGQRTVPQIFIDGKSIGGFHELMALEQSGKLVQGRNNT
jgi:glutaredoxin 3